MKQENIENYVVQIDEIESINNSKPKSTVCKQILLLFSVVFIVSGVIGGMIFLNNYFGGDNSAARASSSGNKILKIRPKSCPTVPPSKRVVVFWQSEKGGCEKLPQGVTHIVWGFAEIKKGTNVLEKEFQTSKTNMIKCIQILRERCVFSLGSIGGAHNTKAFSEINDSELLATSVLELVQEYNLDGVDIDDETVGREFDAARIISYVKAIYTKLKTGPKQYIISFDGFFYGGYKKFCSDPNNLSFTRCFPKEVAKYVDWVNIMAYNVHKDKEVAKGIYENTSRMVFKEWIDDNLEGDGTKVTLGACTKSGCAYGPGPSPKVIDEWLALAKSWGGVMLYASSAEVDSGFSVTKQMVNGIQ